MNLSTTELPGSWGIYIKTATPVMENIILRGNNACDNGGAIAVTGDASPVICDFFVSETLPVMVEDLRY